MLFLFRGSSERETFLFVHAALHSGVLLLCRGSAERAEKFFNTMLDLNPTNAPALLGKVSASFYCGYQDSDAVHTHITVRPA